MSYLLKRLHRPLTTHVFDIKAGQIGTWLAAILVLVAGMLKLSRMGLSEREVFFGVLLVLTVSLLMVLIGLVLPMTAKQPSRDE